MLPKLGFYNLGVPARGVEKRSDYQSRSVKHKEMSLSLWLIHCTVQVKWHKSIKQVDTFPLHKLLSVYSEQPNFRHKINQLP